MDITDSSAVRPTQANQLVRDVVLSRIGPSGGLVAQTVRRLGEAVNLGIFPVGERLPAESDLAEQLGISAMTLREALAIMREAGYLETRRGRMGGTYINPDALSMTERGRSAGTPEISEELARDLTDYRIAIGAHSAALAASRATPDEIDELRALIKQMDNAETFAEFRKADASFHVMISSCTRSPRLVKAEADVQSEITPLARGAFNVGPHWRHATNSEHADILAAIESRAPDLARERMTAHLHSSFEAVEGFLKADSATHRKT
ncbi:FadR/GntR family transcriptional regulator [Paenarthrobacter sp. NEAU-H11]|uniref:FadR/GntR family transcriptional regulator n=1 Tax=Paenarthrobacter sp. NEAU-H11 TaxID=3423924 RepID=UPI003D34051E